MAELRKQGCLQPKAALRGFIRPCFASPLRSLKLARRLVGSLRSCLSAAPADTSRNARWSIRWSALVFHSLAAALWGLQ